MKIDKSTISKIAHLARLEFDEKGAEKLSDEMNKILDWVEKLKEVDTTNVEPLTTMSSEINDMREDKVVDQMDRESGMKNAPKSDSEYFRVPKVME